MINALPVIYQTRRAMQPLALESSLPAKRGKLLAAGRASFLPPAMTTSNREAAFDVFL